MISLDSISAYEPGKHYITVNKNKTNGDSLGLVKRNIFTRIHKHLFPKKYDATKVAKAICNLVKKQGFAEIKNSEAVKKFYKWVESRDKYHEVNKSGLRRLGMLHPSRAAKASSVFSKLFFKTSLNPINLISAQEDQEDEHPTGDPTNLLRGYLTFESILNTECLRDLKQIELEFLKNLDNVISPNHSYTKSELENYAKELYVIILKTARLKQKRFFLEKSFGLSIQEAMNPNRAAQFKEGYSDRVERLGLDIDQHIEESPDNLQQILSKILKGNN